jgi:penicillin amidase
MRRVSDTISVRDSDPIEADLRFTRHGPVIYEDPERHLAFAVRPAWVEPGTAPYLGSMDYMRAENLDEFLAAMNRWGAPPENQLFADPSGTIAWKPAGLTPIRGNWTGSLPVPGDGRYEWDGFRDMDELPVAINPERGWLATANEMNLPKDYPADRVIAHDWYAPSRAERLAEIFGGQERFSPEDCVRLQSDFVSLPARRILRRLDGLEADTPACTEALELLGAWNADLAPDSAAAALFEVWYRRHLRPALLRRALAEHVPEDRLDAALQTVLPEEDLLADSRVDLDLLERPGPALEPHLDELLRTTLADAVAHLEDLLGPDRDRWSWGRLHVARMGHTASPLLDAATRERLALGPLPRGGSGDTVGNTAYNREFVQTGGATFRIVVDVGNWDGSLAMNSPGQSGNPDSPHYADLFEPWARGDAFPLAYTRERVESVTEQRFVLRPRT